MPTYTSASTTALIASPYSVSPTSRLCKRERDDRRAEHQRAVDEAAQPRRLDAHREQHRESTRYISVNSTRNGSVVANCSGV